MKPEEAREAYNEVSESYSCFYESRFGKLFVDITVSRIKDFSHNQEIKILDLGCGHCTISREIVKELNVSEVKAVDVSGEMINSARQKMNSELGSVFEFEVNDIGGKGDFKADYYDMVLLQGGVLSYVESPLDVLKNVEEAKTSDGLAFVSILPQYSYALFDLKSRGVKNFLDTIDKSGTEDTEGIPIRVFRNSEVEALVSKANLEVVTNYPKISFVNHLESGRREEVLESHYSDFRKKELANSRDPVAKNGLQNTFVLR